MMPDESPLQAALDLIADFVLFLCASPASGCAENFRLFWGLLLGGRFEARRSV